MLHKVSPSNCSLTDLGLNNPIPSVLPLSSRGIVVGCYLRLWLDELFPLGILRLELVGGKAMTFPNGLCSCVKYTGSHSWQLMIFFNLA